MPRRESAGARIALHLPRLRSCTCRYAHFDEWWGELPELSSYDTMGQLMTRLVDTGKLVMSRSPLPYAEARTCHDLNCGFCPCGAVRFEMRGGGSGSDHPTIPVGRRARGKNRPKLLVNDVEVTPEPARCSPLNRC